MVKNGRWCPLGCGKCVINVGWSNKTLYKCMKCESEFTLKDFEGFIDE